jgi:CRISPR system Cascade subunit CasD
MRHLILRLEGPLMSFGETAIDERFATARFPSLSMVCGLLANACGMCRTRPAEIQELQDTMEIASRVDRPGQRLRDYQTAQLSSRDEVWTSSGRVAGRDGGSSGLFTVQIEKEYWSDAAITVAVALPDERIDVMVSALREPARALFLGRVSCPPSRPILAKVAEANDVKEALERWPADDGKPATMLAQWPDHLDRVNGSRSALVTDRKDWRNRMHVGSRRVREGDIRIGAAT